MKSIEKPPYFDLRQAHCFTDNIKLLHQSLQVEIGLSQNLEISKTQKTKAYNEFKVMYPKHKNQMIECLIQDSFYAISKAIEPVKFANPQQKEELFSKISYKFNNFNSVFTKQNNKSFYLQYQDIPMVVLRCVRKPSKKFASDFGEFINLRVGNDQIECKYKVCVVYFMNNEQDRVNIITHAKKQNTDDVKLQYISWKNQGDVQRKNLKIQIDDLADKNTLPDFNTQKYDTHCCELLIYHKDKNLKLCQICGENDLKHQILCLECNNQCCLKCAGLLGDNMLSKENFDLFCKRPYCDNKVRMCKNSNKNFNMKIATVQFKRTKDAGVILFRSVQKLREIKDTNSEQYKTQQQIVNKQIQILIENFQQSFIMLSWFDYNFVKWQTEHFVRIMQCLAEVKDIVNQNMKQYQINHKCNSKRPRNTRSNKQCCKLMIDKLALQQALKICYQAIDYPQAFRKLHDLCEDDRSLPISLVKQLMHPHQKQQTAIITLIDKQKKGQISKQHQVLFDSYIASVQNCRKRKNLNPLEIPKIKKIKSTFYVLSTQTDSAQVHATLYNEFYKLRYYNSLPSLKRTRSLKQDLFAPKLMKIKSIPFLRNKQIKEFKRYKKQYPVGKKYFTKFTKHENEIPGILKAREHMKPHINKMEDEEKEELEYHFKILQWSMDNGADPSMDNGADSSFRQLDFLRFMRAMYKSARIIQKYNPNLCKVKLCQIQQKL